MTDSYRKPCPGCNALMQQVNELRFKVQKYETLQPWLDKTIKQMKCELDFYKGQYRQKGHDLFRKVKA